MRGERDHILLKFDRLISRTAVEEPIKFQKIGQRKLLN